MCYRIENSVVAKNAITEIGICSFCKIQMNGGAE